MDMEAAQASDIVGMGVLCGYGNRALLTRCTKNIFQNVPDAVTRIING
jgi:phosphoglycolate phosphatase-like HAD superfamily hydrolase